MFHKTIFIRITAWAVNLLEVRSAKVSCNGIQQSTAKYQSTNTRDVKWGERINLIKHSHKHSACGLVENDLFSSLLPLDPCLAIDTMQSLQYKLLYKDRTKTTAPVKHKNFDITELWAVNQMENKLKQVLSAHWGVHTFPSWLMLLNVELQVLFVFLFRSVYGFTVHEVFHREKEILQLHHLRV